MIVLREVVADDLERFFLDQLDPDACALAAFPAHDREAFDAHWAKILADRSVINRTIVADGEVVGYVACFGPPGEREVAYWIGREWWGRGVASEALRQLIALAEERPLHAVVVEHNVPSLRVLQKCGFVRVGASQAADDGVIEISLELPFTTAPAE